MLAVLSVRNLTKELGMWCRGAGGTKFSHHPPNVLPKITSQTYPYNAVTQVLSGQSHLSTCIHSGTIVSPNVHRYIFR